MRVQHSLGLQSAILITQPPPAEVDISPEILESYVQKALEQAKARSLSGPAVTPYLLEQVKIISGGASLITNLALLKQNAKLAAQIAVALSSNTNYPSI